MQQMDPVSVLDADVSITDSSCRVWLSASWDADFLVFYFEGSLMSRFHFDIMFSPQGVFLFDKNLVHSSWSFLTVLVAYHSSHILSGVPRCTLHTEGTREMCLKIERVSTLPIQCQYVCLFLSSLFLLSNMLELANTL